MTFNEILTGFDDILYTWLLIYMLAGAGIYFTVRSGFVQIRLLKEAFNCMFEKRPGDKGVSSFQALMIATASRVGFRSAFNFRAIFGGFTGSCMVYGIKRGLFSNEAGMGSAPNASASATVSHPVKQGLAQIISVYIDTLLICSTTVFILLLTGQYAGGKYDGIPLIQQSVASQFGTFSIHIVTAAVCLFAFTSIIGNYFYAESNIRFISKNKTFITLFRIAAAIMVFFGAQNDMEVAWSLADITMGLEAVVNIIAISLLSKIAFKALGDYEKKKAEGTDPVFCESDIGLDNTDVWKDGNYPFP